jgi:hypothetical protein
MKKNSLKSLDETDVAPLKSAASSPLRFLLKNPHFRIPANLPMSQSKRQKLARSLQESVSDPQAALEKQRIREMIEKASPHEREILRKIGFKMARILRQAGIYKTKPNEPKQPQPSEAHQSVP